MGSGAHELQHHPPPSGGGTPALRNQRHLHPELKLCSEPSYKEALLRKGGSDRQGRSSLLLSAENKDTEEGWQVVKLKRQRRCTTSQPNNDAHRQVERSALYLRKMKGLCFNCLSPDHKVALCRDPTRCWRCRCFGHISTECCLSCSEQPSNNILGHSPSSSEQPPNNIPGHNLRGSDVGSKVDDSFLLFSQSMPLIACERKMDPMLLEASLMDHRGTSAAPSVDCSVVNRNPPTEEIQTPMLLRSEAKQLVGHELIKALSDFKQLTVAPSSPHTQQLNASSKKAVVESPLDTRSTNHHRRTKVKSRKPGVKVVRDMLTKKWVFVKRDKKLRVNKQLSGLIEVARYLEALRLPP